MIGRATIAWGQIEAGLDFAVWTIHQRLGGDAICADLPRVLSWKLVFLKKAAKAIPALAPYKARIVELCEAVRTESRKRHDLIHGFAVKRPGETQGSISGLRFVRSGKDWALKLAAFDTAEIAQLANRSAALAAQSVALGDELFVTFCFT